MELYLDSQNNSSNLQEGVHGHAPRTHANPHLHPHRSRRTPVGREPQELLKCPDMGAGLGGQRRAQHSPKKPGRKKHRELFLKTVKRVQHFPLSADVGNTAGAAAPMRADHSIQGTPELLQSRGETTDFSTTAELAMPFWSCELVCCFVYLRYNS